MPSSSSYSRTLKDKIITLHLKRLEQGYHRSKPGVSNDLPVSEVGVSEVDLGMILT